MKQRSGAVVGLRGIGRMHLQMMQATGRITPVAVCDIDPSLKESVLQEFPDVRFYTDRADMLQKEKLDVVAVATPHNLHLPVALDAIAAGVHVVVEKPMATTYEDCLAMIAAAEKNGVLLTVFHNRRWDPYFLAARDVIQAGLLGRVFDMTVRVGSRDHLPAWRRFKEATGGTMFDWGAHFVDYCLHFDTSPVKAVSGHLYKEPDSDPRENPIHGTLRIYFQSGATANITVSVRDFHCPLRYKILGTKGTLIDHWGWEQRGVVEVFTASPNGDEIKTEVPYRQADVQGFYDNLVAAIERGEPLAVSAESAARNINVLCAAERSHERGGVPVGLSP